MLYNTEYRYIGGIYTTVRSLYYNLLYISIIISYIIYNILKLVLWYCILKAILYYKYMCEGK